MAHEFKDYIAHLREPKRNPLHIKNIADFDDYSVLKLYAGYLRWLAEYHQDQKFTVTELLFQLAVVNAYQIQLFSEYAPIEQAVPVGENVPTLAVNHYFDGEIPAVEFENKEPQLRSIFINTRLDPFVKTLDQQAYDRVLKNTNLYLRVKNGIVSALFVTALAICVYGAVNSSSIIASVFLALGTIAAAFGFVRYGLKSVYSTTTSPNEKIITADPRDNLEHKDRALFKVKKATIDKTVDAALQSERFSSMNKAISQQLMVEVQPELDNGLEEAVATTSTYFLNKRYDGLYSNYMEYRSANNVKQHIKADMGAVASVNIEDFEKYVAAKVAFK